MLAVNAGVITTHTSKSVVKDANQITKTNCCKVFFFKCKELFGHIIGCTRTDTVTTYNTWKNISERYKNELQSKEKSHLVRSMKYVGRQQVGKNVIILTQENFHPDWLIKTVIHTD